MSDTSTREGGDWAVKRSCCHSEKVLRSKRGARRRLAPETSASAPVLKPKEAICRSMARRSAPRSCFATSNQG